MSSFTILSLAAIVIILAIIILVGTIEVAKIKARQQVTKDVLDGVIRGLEEFRKGTGALEEGVKRALATTQFVEKDRELERMLSSAQEASNAVDEIAQNLRYVRRVVMKLDDAIPAHS